MVIFIQYSVAPFIAEPLSDEHIERFNASVVRDDIALGIPPALVKAFYSTGLSEDRLGHVYGKAWLDRYNSDPEWQRLHAAGDPVVTMRYKAANMYVTGRRPNVSAEEEMAVLAQLRAAGW